MYQNVAGLYRTRKQGILNLCFQYEAEDTFDVTLVSVRRETLEQDGARHGDHGCVCELDADENLPSTTESLATTRACKSL